MAGELISVEEAQKRALAPVRALGKERVAVAAALGRVLAEDVVAPDDSPPHDNSAMDGFAFDGAQLQPGTTATTVRVDNGSALTTDGPYAETKELLGGFYLIDVGDLDAALDFAAKVPAARMGGAVEVRPLVER